MKPTNIFSSVENYKRYNSSKGDHSHGSSKKSAKKNSLPAIGLDGEPLLEIGKLQYANREDKSLSLAIILKREFDY